MSVANIDQNNDAYIIELAEPGLERKDFNIQLGKNDITIQAEKKMKVPTKSIYTIISKETPNT